MSEYPQLAAMGITNPDQIERYSVNSMSQTDSLQIVYKRPKGSFLPVSRTYKFPRLPQKSTDDAGVAQFKMRTCPEFNEAEKELKEILSNRRSRKVSTAAMREELRRMEEEFALHASALRDLIDELEDK